MPILLSQKTQQRHTLKRSLSVQSSSLTTQTKLINISWPWEATPILGVKELRPINPLYVEAVSYCTYRLANKFQHLSPRRTSKIRDYIKQLALKLSRHHFSGVDSIIVLDFLIQFVRKANIQKMSKAQALVALPSFLKRFAKSRYKAVAKTMSPEGGKIFSWQSITISSQELHPVFKN